MGNTHSGKSGNRWKNLEIRLSRKIEIIKKCISRLTNEWMNTKSGIRVIRINLRNMENQLTGVIKANR
jgi:hypothetical protein